MLVKEKKLKEIATGKKELAKPKKLTHLPTSFQDYKAQLIKELEEFDELEYKGSVSQYLVKLIKPVPYFQIKRENYTGKSYDDYKNGYKYFCLITQMINQKIQFVPTIYDFLKFMAVPSSTFYEKLAIKDPLGELLTVIFDDFKSGHIQSMQNGEIQAIPGIFIAKSTLQMKDAEAPITNINVLNTDMSAEDIVLEWNKNKRLTE